MIAPDDGSQKRSTSRPIVVLPEPLGPTSAHTSPGCTCKEMSWTTGTSRSRYVKLTPANSSSPRSAGAATGCGGSAISGGVSRISKMRAVAPKVDCSPPTSSASAPTAPATIIVYSRKLIRLLAVIVPSITMLPPSQNTPAIEVKARNEITLANQLRASVRRMNRPKVRSSAPP